MVLSIYTRPDGAYVLVKPCKKPPKWLEKLNGMLIHCADVETDEYPILGMWERVLAELEEHSFAVLQSSVGQQLLGVECHPSSDEPSN